MAGSLYLDDLHVGQRFTSGKAVVTAEEIKRFAAQFDPQPFHLDEAAAANSMFGGLAASGWHTGALTMRLLVDGGAPLAGGVIGAGGELAGRGRRGRAMSCRFSARSTEITPSRSKPDRGIVAVRSETRNQRGEAGAGVASPAKLLVPRRPGA